MVTRRVSLPASSYADFGALLRVLRRRTRLTQRQLGLAVGYSEAQICRLEQSKRRPDPAVVAALFLPALRLADEPELAARLHELAVLARGQGPDRDPAPGAGRDAPQTMRGPNGAAAGAEPATGPGPAAGTGPAAGPGDRAGPRRAADRASAEDLAAIPARPSHYVHRGIELAELRERLAADQRVVVCGLPGVGKTSLAGALAREAARGSPVCWITMTAGVTASAEAAIRLMARFLARHGYQEAGALRNQAQLERSLPRDEQLDLINAAMTRADALICIDNAHLVQEEPDVRMVIEHMASSSSARMLALSRQDLPLAGFAPFRLAGLARAQARALASDLAGPQLPESLADALIDRTDGSPMLIRLALGQLRPGGPGAAVLIDRLEAEPGIAGYLLQATLADLTEPSRRLIRLMAVFRQPVDLLNGQLIEASEELGGPFDVLAGLDELRRRQLVEHSARAELHPLVRDHVYAGLLGAATGRRQLHLLAAHHCEQVLDQPLEASWHYARAGRPAEAADLLAARTVDLTARGSSARAADLAGELLAAGRLTSEAEWQLLVARGDLLLHTERAGEAEDAYRDALSRCGPAAVRAGVAWRLAQSLLQRGQVAEALELCRAAAAALTGKEEVLRAQLSAVQSRAHLMLSEFSEATALAEQACAAAERMAGITPDIARAVQARAYWVLGVTARLRGRPQDAADWLRCATMAGRATGLLEVAGRALFNLGAIAQERGEISQAETSYAEALAQMRQIGDGYGIARVLHALGMIRSQAGQPEEAIRLYDEACALMLRVGDPLGAANSKHALALILMSQGRTEEARERLSAVLAATDRLGERVARADYLDSLAMVDLTDGDHSRARRHLAEAARIVAEVDHPSLDRMIRIHMALALLASGDLAAAEQVASGCAAQAAGADQLPVAVAIERAALTAFLALAAGDQTGAQASAAEMASRASGAGDLRYYQAAQRISAVIRAPAAARPAAAELPRLIWVTVAR